ncbi:uncharacterized protein PGTG_11470 [Puccinia graminis f. sp. tritici CRL 75-36-700-3]|uniref:Uncharacterized protein n=1 Tax=Puccinia graminis f. sp. tritici (strain CRL 75-36-700-3 / race SCCL) TaxID=418459 RepID=E3KLV2_PUCGT|nr:uncharacterized protein PGTG_11470 [Puccinia graminis f. sp. tritici CRL 75-36-700-3]EFP85301.1 hypothetical protein PGTG_11470 [Puccinia graminis f. sp. tritici CRL 75-36-700-3]
MVFTERLAINSAFRINTRDNLWYRYFMDKGVKGGTVPAPKPPPQWLKQDQRVSERVSLYTCHLHKGGWRGWPAIDRKVFLPANKLTWHMSLVGQKENLPVGKDSKENGASKPKSESSGGYPFALEGIRQRITGIHNGYPEAVSSTVSSLEECPQPKGRGHKAGRTPSWKADL